MICSDTNKVLFRRDFVNASFLNGTRLLIFYSFAIDQPPRTGTKKVWRGRIKPFQKNHSVLNKKILLWRKWWQTHIWFSWWEYNFFSVLRKKLKIWKRKKQRHWKKTEGLLFSIVKIPDELPQQTKTKAPKEIQTTKVSETFSFDLQLSIRDGEWMLELNSLEV